MRKSERKTVTHVKARGEAAGEGLPGLSADAMIGALGAAGLSVPVASREALGDPETRNRKPALREIVMREKWRRGSRNVNFF